MARYKKFANSELTPEEEEKYLNDIYDKYYDKKLNEKYSKLLESEHGIKKGTSGPQANNTPKSGGRRIVLSSILALAACGLFAFYFLGGLGSGLINQTDSYLEESIFKNQELLRGDINSEEIRNEAVLAYNEGDMSKALESYTRLENKSQSDLFFEGMAHMYNKDYKAAIANFEGITNNTFKYKAEMAWYQSLCYIKTDQKSKAIQTLKSLDTWKQKEAAALIDLLSK